jgi:hypothetical protein
VTDPRHHRKLFVRIGQQLEEFDQIVEASNAVELAAHDNGRHFNLGRIDHRQVCTHIDVRQRALERQEVYVGWSAYLLLLRHAGLRNNWTPCRQIGLDQCGELVWSADRQLDAECIQPLLDDRHRQYGGDFGAQPGDDVLGVPPGAKIPNQT